MIADAEGPTPFYFFALTIMGRVDEGRPGTTGGRGRVHCAFSFSPDKNKNRNTMWSLMTNLQSGNHFTFEKNVGVRCQ